MAADQEGRLRNTWPRSARRAIELQRRLRRLVLPRGSPKHVLLVAGADVAYDAASGSMCAAVMVFSFPSLVLRESRIVHAPVRFPYIPGLLSFREAPVIVRAFRRLRSRPDLLLCDGQGIAHPRGVGLASHLGLALDVPTIGCAKSRLVGEHRTPADRRGAHVPLRLDGRVVGAVLRTRPGVRPLYISPGHRVGTGAAIRYVLACCRGFRLPEPVRQADIVVGAAKRRERPKRPGVRKRRGAL